MAGSRSRFAPPFNFPSAMGPDRSVRGRAMRESLMFSAHQSGRRGIVMRSLQYLPHRMEDRIPPFQHGISMGFPFPIHSTTTIIVVFAQSSKPTPSTTYLHFPDYYRPWIEHESQTLDPIRPGSLLYFLHAAWHGIHTTHFVPLESDTLPSPRYSRYKAMELADPRLTPSILA